MNEVELKILDIDPQQVEQKLSGIGAQKVFHGSLVAYFFDTIDGELKRSGQTCRMRIEENVLNGKKETILTHKKKLRTEGVKSCIETEIEAHGTVEEVQQYIKALTGYEVQQKVMKTRTSYKLNDIRYEIDIYTGEMSFIKPLLEAEAASEKRVVEALQLLGYSKEDFSTFGFAELKEFYGMHRT